VLAPVNDDTSFAALVLSHVASVLGSLITTPLLVAVTTFVYIDLRLRKEGVDPLGAGGPSGDAAQAPERDAFGDSVVRWEPPVAPEPLPPPGERGD